MNDKMIVVTGATGTQGTATLRHLARHGSFKLRALTHDTTGIDANELTTLGVELVKCDVDDHVSLQNSLAGAWGVFLVQSTDDLEVKDVNRFEARSKRVVAVARERGVQHFVYSSIGSADRATGVSYFEAKARVEEHVEKAGFPTYSIVRPTFVMEMLVTPAFQQNDQLVSSLSPTTKLQMIAADDIGSFVAQSFLNHKKWNAAVVDLAGDLVTLADAATLVGEIYGKTFAYEQVPVETVRTTHGEHFASILEWLDKTGFTAPVEDLEGKWGVRPLSLHEWIATKKTTTEAPTE